MADWTNELDNDWDLCEECDDEDENKYPPLHPMTMTKGRKTKLGSAVSRIEASNPGDKQAEF